MAGRFRCDTDAARRVSQELSRIRSDMNSSGQPQDYELDEAVYPSIGQALQQFAGAAAKTKADLGAAVEQASALFGRLAEGTIELDQQLAEGISQ
jgi:hypothetical protein